MEYDFSRVNDRRGTYCTQWDFTEDRFHRAGVLPFSISDTDFIIPEPITEKIKAVAERRIYGYTRWNHHDYKASIVNFFRRRFDADLSEDWIIYSPTVVYSISLLIRLLSRPGDRVVCFNPMYDSFFTVITGNERELVSCDLVHRDGRFEIDFDLLDRQLSGSRILLLCSPHNPTGRVWTREEMDRIVELCRRHQTAIISDEIHMDIQIGKRRNIPLMQYAGTWPQVYTCSSSSKTFNTPGLIGSYVIIPDAGIRDAFLYHTRKVDFLNSPSILGMYATMIGYQECDDYIEQLCAYVRGNMEYLKQSIETQLKDVSFTIPDATYLAWIDCRKMPFTAEQIQDALVNVGNVGIMKGETYGENGTKYLRMNIGCPRSKLEEGFARMKQSFDWLYQENR